MSRDEVDAMVSQVDEDGSGNIEFPEFLGIIKNSGGDEKSQKIYQFFKDMTLGKYGSDGEFNLLVQRLKRGNMMNAFIGEGE